MASEGSGQNVQVQADQATEYLARTVKLLDNPAPLFRMLAGGLADITEGNFAAQGRPHWAPLAPSTLKRRLARNKGSSVLMILQDRGLLAASVSTHYGNDFAQVGAGGTARAYAAIHQFGGQIQIGPHQGFVRLRANKAGELLNGRARFAKKTHKQVVERAFSSQGHTVNIPARPYLPFSGPPTGARLQPEAQKMVIETVTRFLQSKP
jgi:phage virion morphogenesis protein